MGAAIRFITRKGEQVHARVASSFISFDQAELNLKELGIDKILMELPILVMLFLPENQLIFLLEKNKLLF